MNPSAHLIFSIAGTRCALPASDVLHICGVVALERIEGTQSPVLGICYYSGRAVIGIDLSVGLGADAGLFGSEARMIILNGSEFLYGIPVDRVENLFAIDVEECLRLGRPVEFIVAPCIQEVFLFDGKAVCLIETDHVLQASQREQLRNALAMPATLHEEALR
jgi:chemotaxis signal transduction protein